MIAQIVPIGNSKGIRIPKAILEQCHIKHEVTLDVEGERIILAPPKKQPRRNWGGAFLAMKERGDDALLIDDEIGLDAAEWEW